MYVQLMGLGCTIPSAAAAGPPAAGNVTPQTKVVNVGVANTAGPTCAAAGAPSGVAGVCSRPWRPSLCPWRWRAPAAEISGCGMHGSVSVSTPLTAGRSRRQAGSPPGTCLKTPPAGRIGRGCTGVQDRAQCQLTAAGYIGTPPARTHTTSGLAEPPECQEREGERVACGWGWGLRLYR